MKWLIVASPFILALLLIGVLKASEAYHEWRYTRDRRIRDERINRFSMNAFRGAKDRFLS